MWNNLKKVGRWLALAALVLSGVGLIYLYFRTYHIKPFHRGLVINAMAKNEKAQIEELPSGMHVLLSPFRYFKKSVSTKTRVTALKNIIAKTSDGMAVNVTVTMTYYIKEPLATMDVKNATEAFLSTLKAIVATAIGEFTLQQLQQQGAELVTTRLQELQKYNGYSTVHSQSDTSLAKLTLRCASWGYWVVACQSMLLDSVPRQSFFASAPVSSQDASAPSLANILQVPGDAVRGSCFGGGSNP